MEPPILPRELLIEILLKVPVRSLARFKCVCKSWLSLISDPEFAQLHFDLDHASNQRLLLLAERDDSEIEFRSIDVNAPSFRDDSASYALKLNFQIPISDYYVRILGSCRGFLLLERDRNHYIWNPCSGSHMMLPPSPIFDWKVRNGIIRFPVLVITFLFGFGYDPLTDDYIFTVVSHFGGNYGDYNEIRGQFFSSRANAWRELEVDDLYSIYDSVTGDCCFRIGLNFNEAIHWLTKRPNFQFGPSLDAIVVFDLKERVFSEFSLPSDFRSENNKYGVCRLLVLGGYLCVCINGNNNGNELWVMQEYGVESSWTRSHIVVPPQHADALWFSSMCYTKCGDIVGIDRNKELLKFNDKGDVLDNRRHRFFDHPMKCENNNSKENNEAVHTEWVFVAHTESLLSLPRDRNSG